MQTITVVRGLTMLKNLDKKIQRLTNEAEFVSVKGELRSPSEIAKQAVSRYQQINDLITFRQKLKSTLITSNASTIVKICGRDLSVAETIEEKNSIKHKKELLKLMKQQYTNCVSECERHNAQMRNNLENESRRSQIGGYNTNSDDKKTDSKSSEEYQKGYMKLHKIELYDPINISSEISKLETYIENFESEVDHVLSESNAITTIEVPDLKL